MKQELSNTGGRGSTGAAWVWILVVVGVLVVLGLIFFGWYVSNYNKAVALEEDVKKAWGDIETMLTRRYNLIPNLVKTVKAFAKHETEVFANVTEARTHYMAAKTVGEKAAAASILDRAMFRVLALSENYPTLRSSENFSSLQDELAGSENRIAVQRVRYNESVKTLNAYYRSFFGGFFCRQAGVQMAEPYAAPEKKHEVPEVEFD